MLTYNVAKIKIALVRGNLESSRHRSEISPEETPLAGVS